MFSGVCEQLDKAEAYAKKVLSVLETAKKPDELTDDQWKQQSELQKGLALSSLGQINIQKKDNAQAVTSFRAAAPLLKPDDGTLPHDAEPVIAPHHLD